MIVLHYLRADEKRFEKFVANRVAKILEGSTVDQWRYVASKNNPADFASRGLRTYQDDKLQRWLLGPEFLWDHQEKWDAQPEILFPDKMITSALMVRTLTFWKQIFEKYSSWKKLVRVVARIFQVLTK